MKPVFIRPIHVRFFNLRASHSLIGGVCLAAVLGCGSAKVDTTSDAGLDTSDHQDPIGQNTSDNEQPNDGVEPLSPNDDSAPIDDSNPDATVAPGAEDSDASSIDVTAPDPNTGGGFVTIDTGDDGRVEVLCGSSPCACSDGLDNDGDGLVDGFDPECTSPFDNDEGSFATGIPGDNVDPKWQDCFFDGNSGAGDDGCRYHTDCLTGDLPADHRDCVLSTACVEFCAPLTPPGCDCFGCCEVPFDGSTINVILANTCSLDELDDEGKCPRCEPTTVCGNECGECEICVGKTAAELPDSCTGTPDPDTPDGPDGGATPGDPGDPGDPGTDTDGGAPSTPDGDDPPILNSCDNDQPCTSDSACGSSSYCRLGCCTPVPTVR